MLVELIGELKRNETQEGEIFEKGKFYSIHINLYKNCTVKTATKKLNEKAGKFTCGLHVFWSHIWFPVVTAAADNFTCQRRHIYQRFCM